MYTHPYRTIEALGLHYKIPWPGRELESGRPMRRSALYTTLREEKHARFGNKMGWERPNFFPTDKPEMAVVRCFSSLNSLAVP